MKKSVIIAALLTLFVFIPVVAQETNFFIQKEEVRESLTGLAGNTVINDGRIADDFFAAGQYITNNGQVDGDIFAAGRTLSIGGDVRGSIRAIGADINFKGSTARNVTTAGGSITVESNAVIQGSTMAAGKDITINGTINKSLYAAGKTVIIGGTVLGDAFIAASDLTVLPGAKINGNLTYHSDKEANIAQGTVSGEVTKKEPVINPEKAAETAKNGFTAFAVFFKLLWFIGAFLLGALLIKLFGKFFENMPDTVLMSWLKHLGIGALAFVSVPLICIMLFLTVIGIPMAIVSVLAYVLLLIIAKIPVSIFIGDLIVKQTNIYLKLLIGLAVLAIVGLIPYLGGLTGFVVTLIGFGIYIEKIFFARE